jgi:membrane protein implicated in regulation of membrane protease activity
MSSPERQLRLVQCSLIVFIVVCFFVKRIGRLETHDALSPVQWLIIVAAIWSAISGFTVQRRINRIGSRSQTQPRRSTPVSRWRTGHLVRLWTATAMGLWGFLLHYTGGPEWLVNVFLGLAVLLLLIWRPGATPAPAQP